MEPPPDREFIARRVAESVANAGETGLGMWFVEDVSTRYAGCFSAAQLGLGAELDRTLPKTTADDLRASTEHR
jgi:hypothetical protein